MPNMLDNEFMVSSYINGRDTAGKINNTSISSAIDWANNAIRTIIIPTEDLQDLEDQWVKFNSMIKKHRRESDWKSIELFGITNQDHYEMLKSKLLQRDIDNEIENDEFLDTDGGLPFSEGAIDLDYTSSYYDNNVINYTSIDVEKAIKWGQDNNRTIIIPTRNLEELESLWDAYNGMIKKHRRESDWMSLEVFGVTNLKHYEYLKSQFLRQDIRSNDVELYGLIESAKPVGDSIQITGSYLKEACKTTPSIHIANKLLSMCLIDKGIYENMLTDNIVSDVLDTYDGVVSNAPEAEINYGDMPFITPDEAIDSGVFSDIPSQNFYGVIADNQMLTDNISVAEWFEMYRAHFDGFYTEFAEYMPYWVQKVRELTYGLKILEAAGDEKAIAKRKQSILELCWDPEIRFGEKERLMAKIKMESFGPIRRTPVKMIDVRGMLSNRNIPLIETKTIKDLKPVFVVLTEGKRLISKAIKAVTKDIYSHVSISFDPTLKKMYSYGIDGNPNGIKGGFNEENIDKIPLGSRIRVYAFFLKPEDYKIITNMVIDLQNKVLQTRYSYKNLFTYLFNIPYNNDLNMVCSQFVDRCLKLCDIDLTHKDSSLVSPHDIKTVMKENRSIYTLYEGLANKYNAEQVSKTVNALLDTAKPIKEAIRRYQPREYVHEILSAAGDIDRINMLKPFAESVLDKNSVEYRVLKSMVFAPTEAVAFCESKEFPVQFDKDGNMILKNIKSIDYDEEYRKSHNLLKEYFNNENTVGMKYELAKLWMILNIIENKVHSRKFMSMPVEDQIASKEYKAKSKIMNDFKHYMKKLLEMEPEFNFSEYFENSPFSNATIKLKASTVETVAKFLKSFIRKI